MTIEQHCDILRTAGIQSVDLYEKKLRDNQNDTPRLEDLGCEGRVALIFQAHGWSVTMRESPDLEGWIDGVYLGIEVKHCRWKPDHDPVVEATLRSSHGEFVKIPRLIETEKHEEEWEQMYRFAKKNSHQFVDGALNVLFFVSHTEAHDELTLEAAGNRYEEELALASCVPAMRNLNAMMTIGGWQRRGPDPRSIYAKFLHGARTPIPPQIQQALYDVRDEPSIQPSKR